MTCRRLGRSALIVESSVIQTPSATNRFSVDLKIKCISYYGCYVYSFVDVVHDCGEIHFSYSLYVCMHVCCKIYVLCICCSVPIINQFILHISIHMQQSDPNEQQQKTARKVTRLNWLPKTKLNITI